MHCRNRSDIMVIIKDTFQLQGLLAGYQLTTSEDTVRKDSNPDNEQSNGRRCGPETHKGSLGGISPELYAKNMSFIALTMNDFLVSHMLRVYHLFHGDIVQALILGVIAHHNVSVLVRKQEYNRLNIKKALLTSGDQLLMPSNTFSISQATGIPRETVRRKIALLVRKGLITRDSRGHLFLTDVPQKEFADFTYETADAFLYTAQRMLHECQKGSSGI
jgi:hypothetical protein